ncbi:MAG: hypothetical protein KA085_19665 [Phenylobacterium sp.]|uniref:ribbon-helix-helix domain-containing protein n=1 Tax=Phenylobacterium sp. TaxID=1871053 RepID=UPI001B6F73C0|nr:ribbon-helix-helix domain-containing protein [Phenylobacterium sp.]MBP7818341.1 hypothetical protein [Phenylobacterium sp.]
MSRFAAIRSEKSKPASPPPSETADLQTLATPTRVTARSGKKAVSGYFSLEMSRGLHLLALEQGSSLQALMGEAFDDLMRKYGKHPFGER